MNNAARWKALMEWLTDNSMCTKDEILIMIDKIKKGERNK